MQKATFGAGCFWEAEEKFHRVPGVVATVVGYAGGTVHNPTYRDVCAGTSGHAEVVEIQFDPAQVSYEQLLEVFWDHHDPTSVDRQGPDVGPHYRSVIFTHSSQQEAAASASRDRRQASGRHPRPIVTEIRPAPAFYPAEDYHQMFFTKRNVHHKVLIPS